MPKPKTKFTVSVNYCQCHPETCGCNDWAIFRPDGTKHSTYFHRETADEVANALNRSLQSLSRRSPMLTPESVIPWLEGKPTVASILEQHQTDSARVAELEGTSALQRAMFNEAMDRATRAENRLENIRQLTTTKHETLAQFVSRVRGALYSKTR